MLKGAKFGPWVMFFSTITKQSQNNQHHLGSCHQRNSFATERRPKHLSAEDRTQHLRQVDPVTSYEWGYSS